MGAGAEGGEEKKEEDDAEVARQLHRAMNSTPARVSRRRGNPPPPKEPKEEAEIEDLGDSDVESEASDLHTYRPNASRW